MKYIFHSNESRGSANHGWLDTKHTFSFANYYNPDRVHFGALRVLNDDIIQAAMGFGMHPHDNMEIITIPLSGSLTHEDSMHNKADLKKGEIQMMSAGTGILHSEYNSSKTEDLSLLQIWVFPEQKNIEPRYEQIEINEQDLINNIYTFIKPFGHESPLNIHQQAWFSLTELAADKEITYTLNDSKSGVYVFLIEGEVTLNNEIQLDKRDGAGITDIKDIVVAAKKQSRILFIEVPVQT